MKKVLISFFFTCFINNSLLSQQCMIAGNVTEDYTNGPLDFATITAEDNLKKLYLTNTDSGGAYMLELPAKRKYTVKCSYLGYKAVEKKLIIPNCQERKTLDFRLQVEEINLDDIKIFIICGRLIDLDSIQFSTDTIKKKKFTVSKLKK